MVADRIRTCAISNSDSNSNVLGPLPREYQHTLLQRDVNVYSTHLATTPSTIYIAHVQLLGHSAKHVLLSPQQQTLLQRDLNIYSTHLATTPSTIYIVSVQLVKYINGETVYSAL
ncbi:hypothetical protein J6590_007432 [Homalodisca vitripennis]|nr:hypothetical protein J6590_007426 [Homalodisca vitripennis]KAG8298837.1 hypothetical protein J6590_007432 [Homalodisca vitripennis]